MSRHTMDRLSILQKKNTSRMSMLLNEDDYDYALELRPDDEYRQAAEALPKLVDFDDIDLSEICQENNDSENAGNIQPFSAAKKIRETTEFNTQRNRHSNFDQSMLELHASKAPRHRSSIANYNLRCSTTNEDNLSHWGAVDATGINISGNFAGADSLETDDLEACNFEPSDEEDEENDQRDTQYDRRITGMGTGLLSNAALEESTGINFHATTSSSNSSTFSSRWRKLSKKEFSFRLNLLEKHRKWVERAARRSSIGFHRHHPSSDKEAMDKFLVAMAGGVHIRRHQAYRVSEVVRLFSVTGCRTIEWDKPKARDLLLQRRKHNVHMEGSTNAAFSTKYDKSAFDCCIAICGCGDDLHTGHDPHSHTDASNMYNEDGADEARYSSFGRTFYNIGYRRRGTFRDLDVLAVHPAGKEDPTMVGMLGTECLRRTKDAYNIEMTFSVVMRDTSSSQGYSTLDVECETLDMYYLLLRGFRLLQEEAEVHRGLQRQSGSSADELDLEAGGNRSTNNLFSTKSSDGFLQLQRVDEISALWNSVKGYITRGAWEKTATPDPISELFAPSSQIDPLRALRVGGGLLSVHTTPKSPPTSAHNYNSSAVNSPASPISPPHTTSAAEQNTSVPIAQFLGWNSAGTQIWARLKMAGLDVKCVLSWDLERVILKIRCPNWRLEQMAEQMHIKLKTRDGYLKQFKVSRRDTFAALGSNGAVFRSSERQQIIDYIVRSKIKDGGAELDENTELGKQIVQRFPLHMYSKLNDIRHSWVTFWKREEYGTEVRTWSPFTVPYKVTYHQMKISIQYFLNNLLTQPLDSIAEYFGEHIAFYFAYMAFYTRWLVFPSILGVIVFIVQMYENRLDHWLCPIYAIVVMVWACFMLAFWRQKASALAHRWGVLDYEVEETERPQFRGNYTYDESSGEVRKTYSLWKRTGKYVISIPVLSLAILITLVIMTTVFYSQDEMYNDYLAGNAVDFQPKFPHFHSRGSGILGTNSTSTTAIDSSSNTTSTGIDDTGARNFSLSELQNSSFWAATFFYPCMYGIIVSLLTIVFEFIAICLNDYENHRTQTTYMNRLILKVFSFQFVTIFTSLYYYAFFISDHESAFFQISITVFSLMTVGQWWTVFLDIIVPSIYHRALLYRMKSAFASTNRKIYYAKEYTDYKNKKYIHKKEKMNINHTGKIKNSINNPTDIDSYTELMNNKLQKRSEYLQQAKSKCWEEALQAKYNNFSDYTSMVIQIGFILFFSAVFPLCPLIALLNNILLIRFNAYKICYTRQRPIAQKIGGIGVWEDVLQIMSVGGILTNCALYGFTSAQIKNILYPSIGKTGMAILLFAYEHIILLFKYWLHSSIPMIHPSVQRARSRERKSLNRKSILRSQQAHRTGDPGNQPYPSADSAVASAGKPLRAQGSMLGYWFDLSTRAAGGQQQYTEEEVEQGGVELLAKEESAEIPEGSAVQRMRASAGRGEWDHKSDDSSSDGDQDLPPSDHEEEDGVLSVGMNHPSESNIGRELLLQAEDDDSIPPPEEEENVGFYAQPFSTKRSSQSPQRARSPNPTTTSSTLPTRQSGAGTVRTGDRRSLSPTTRSRPSSPTPASALVLATRDQMISMIHANIKHSIHTPAPVVQASHTPTAAVSRRVSFVTEQAYPVTSQPESSQYLYQPPSEPSDSEEYDFSDDNVSDLSDEAGDYEEPSTVECSHSNAWNMTFTSETSQKLRSSNTNANMKNTTVKKTTTTGATKQSRLQQHQPQQRSPRTKSVKTATAAHLAGPTKHAATRKGGTAPASTAPSGGGVQELLSNWFWPSSGSKPAAGSSAAKVATTNTTTVTGKKNSLNLAPLGQKKNSPRAASKVDVKPAATGPIHSPNTSALRFQDATSPYEALLTPPVVIAPTSGTPGNTANRSPQRAHRVATHIHTTDPPSCSPAQKQKRKPALLQASPIKSPFSYTEEAPAPSSAVREDCKENDRILANLQTGQLQQLLLLQQQQQQQEIGTPKKMHQQKQVGTPTSGAKQQKVSSTTASPARSAIAGSRQRQQQLLATQLTALGWQPATNPYEHIISPGGTPVRADDSNYTENHTPNHLPAPLSLQHPSATPGKSSRSGKQPVSRSNTGSNTARTVEASTIQAPGRTPRRRVSTTTPRRSISRHPLEAATEPTNPFSYASSKNRPERLVYD